MNAEDIDRPPPNAAPDARDRHSSSSSKEPVPEGSSLDMIAEVHTRVLDTIAGFRKVVDKAEPEFRPVAEAFLAMHVGHEGELASHLSACGRDPDDGGSAFGTVNRAAIEIRSWFEEVTDSMMDRIRHGEVHVLNAYETARGSGQGRDTDALLTRHMDDIDALMRKHAR